MNRHHFSMIIAVFLTMTAILFLSACSSAESDLPEQDSPEIVTITEPTPGNIDPGSLDCQVHGYPCSYADTDQHVLNRSAEALEQAAVALDEIGSIEAAVVVLQQQSDLAEILYAPEGIRFRLEGGPPMWLINAEVIASGTKAPGGRQGEIHPMHSIQFSLSGVSGGQDSGPIGESRRGEEPFKKALLLSPFWWEFGGDETQELSTFMRQIHRNYNCDDCEVEWKINNIPPRDENQSPEDYELTKTLSMDFGVSLTDYMKWDEYDLIHISTHGFQLCQDGKCKGFLMTGRFVDRPQWSQTGVTNFDVAGISWGRLALPGCGTLDEQMKSNTITDEAWDAAYAEWLGKGCSTFTNRYWQLAEPDFFKANYSQAGKSLDDKLIFFSACQSMKDLSLAQSVAGDNTTVFGWTEVVEVGPAGQLALKFYELYVGKGLRAQVAFDQVKDEMGESFHGNALRRFKPKGIVIEELLPPEFLSDGDEDTRGREIITLMQPIYRVELKDKGAIPTLGIPGDGIQDKILLLVQVDGIDEKQDSGEFKIHFVINEEELEETIIPQEKVGEYSYWALGLFTLPFDAGEHSVIKLEAWLELPEGGQSRHVLDEVALANCGWMASLSGGKGGEIKGDITFPTATFSSANAEQLAELAGKGYLGPTDLNSSGTPSANELAGAPDSYMLGNQQQYPFLLITPEQAANALLAPNELAFGNQVSVNLVRDDPAQKEGSFSADLIDMTSQSNFSVAGNFIWHVDSMCSLDVIIELGSNPFPESMIPAGLTP